MVELVLELGLLLEAVHGFHAGGDLDGDELAGELGVLGFPHFAEPALAQLLEQGVLRDAVAFLDRPVTHNLSWPGALRLPAPIFYHTRQRPAPLPLNAG